ncbi:MAG: tetratricopeptide repeat protein [Acidobacteria bacterium]|nr:tetratricopeptide repeat protein [Acidobacteriota bacterium]
MMRRYAFIAIMALFLANVLSVMPVKADYKQAVAFYNQKRFDKAIQELKGDLDRNPDWEFGHRLLGLSYLGLNNNALAVSALSRAIQLKSTAFSAYYGLGQAYFNMQKYDNCIAALNQGEPFADKEKEAEKEKAKLFKLRGSAYYRMNRFNEAANDLTKALRVNQSDWADFSVLGICYYNLNRLDEAIPTLEKALSMKPGQSTTSEILGKAYLKKGIAALSEKQYAATIQSLLKAKEYDPQNGFIYYNLAEAYLFQKKYAEAEKAYIQASELMPKSLDAFWRLGFVYEKQKKWDLALSAYKKAADISASKEIKEAIARVNENKKK